MNYTYEYVILSIRLCNEKFGMDSLERDRYYEMTKNVRDSTWLTGEQKQAQYLLILQACQSFIDESRAHNPINIIAGTTAGAIEDLLGGAKTIGERVLKVGDILTKPWLLIIILLATWFLVVFLFTPRLMKAS